MIKNYAYLKLLFWVLIAHIIFFMNSSIQAEDISDAQRLFSDIKLKLAKYKGLEEKYPSLHVYRLKGNYYGVFADYFKVTNEYNTYLRSLNQVQQKDFLEYTELLLKRSTKDFYPNNSLKEITELLKENCSQNERLLTFLKHYNWESEQFTLIEEQRLDVLKKQIKQPLFMDSFIVHINFLGLFNFYSTALFTIEEPMTPVERQIKSLTATLYKINERESDLNKKNEVTNFIKDIYNQLPMPSDNLARTPLRYYYRLKLFENCLSDLKSKGIIKEQLKKHIALRKAVIPLFVRHQATRGDIDRFVKKYESQLDYNDFDKYWEALEKISQNLVQDLFTSIGEPKLEQYTSEQIANSKLAAQYYVECFFTPYLDLNKHANQDNN
jgi:DNA-binding transcriptional regulator GbsR (MarR family)